ncbi:hypothetical protein AWM79_12150 [Pseudomonas agarici]|uniref:Uncharacterized protein n=2 Tax=Pseudomonas agarici TaxID=46677 RepID=A0A0X1T2D4_PSEAA|nr:hypothetical protein AWM79_12150 [Pseudomonas agarici]
MKYEKTLRKLCGYSKLTEELIVAAFKKHEDKDVDVCAKTIEKPGFEIATDVGLCFVTERPISYYNERWGRVTEAQERALPMSLPVPLHIIGEGELNKAIFEMNSAETPKDAADFWLNEFFSPEVSATYFNKFFSVSDSLKDYRLIVFEAIEAYYLGMDHVAIMSLIPVFEAGLRNIQISRLNVAPDNVSGEKFERYLRDIIIQWGRRRLNAYVWHPGKGYNQEIEIDFLTHICPQSDVINAFRLYFKSILYKPSYGEVDGFNRHIIMHLLKNDFNNPANFARIFICLTHITFIESLENQNIPFFWRGIDDKDLKVAAYFIGISKILGDSRRPTLQSLGIDGYEAQSITK